MSCPLQHLISTIPGVALTGDPSLAIGKVTADSREVGPGVLFVAVRGTDSDGHDYVARAVAAGAPAVVVENEYGGEIPATTAVVRCADTRPVPALAARQLYGQPDLKLWTVAVTGTNGKTTTAFLVQEMLQTLYGPCGLLGTIHYDDGQTTRPAPLTTPGGPVFFKNLGRMVTHGCRSVAMELSSHALAQHRTAGLGLDVAVMTNLGRDHLDYHADMADYLAAKARILDLLRPGTAGQGAQLPGVLVLNVGDEHLAGLETGSVPVISFTTDVHSTLGSVDLQIEEMDLQLAGTRLRLNWRGKELQIESPLVGRFNVENLMAALAVGLGLGLAPQECTRALAGVSQVPGRLERFVLPNGAIAVVDYAHTHDALRAVLTACAELTDRELLLVFGCGGDRDKGKRQLMAEVAALGSDQVWITSDNPRSEDPAAICADIVVGYEAVGEPRARHCAVILDRADAIGAALAAAGSGDIVIIAGKGHEDYQLVGDKVLDLDDRRIVAQWISGQQAGPGASK